MKHVIKVLAIIYVVICIVLIINSNSAMKYINTTEGENTEITQPEKTVKVPDDYQEVNYNGKRIIYSSLFANETKTPDELGLKYEKITNGETTNYDACRVCCEKTDAISATGIKVKPGRKIVAKWTKDSFVKYGDWVYIEGYGYALVADCGGFTGKASDKFHLDCYVGQPGDAIDDGRGNYSALKRPCINAEKVYQRIPGSRTNVTIYRIKAEDVPKELIFGTK